MSFSERIANSRPATNPVPAEVDFRCEEWGRILSDAAVKNDFGLSTIAQAYMAKAKLAQPINAAEEKADIAINTPTSPKATDKPLQKITAGDVNAWLRGSNIPNLPTRTILYSILGLDESQQSRCEAILTNEKEKKLDAQRSNSAKSINTTLDFLTSIKDIAVKYPLKKPNALKASIKDCRGGQKKMATWEVIEKYLLPLKSASIDDYNKAIDTYIDLCHENLLNHNLKPAQSFHYLAPKHLEKLLTEFNKKVKNHTNSNTTSEEADSQQFQVPNLSQTDYLNIGNALLTLRAEEAGLSETLEDEKDKRFQQSNRRKYDPSTLDKYELINEFKSNDKKLVPEFDNNIYRALAEDKKTQRSESWNDNPSSQQGRGRY